MDDRINTLATAIQGVLTGIMDEGNPVFGNVFDYPTNAFGSYPAASVSLVPSHSRFAGTKRYVRTYNFRVAIFVKVKSEQLREAWVQARRLADAALDALDGSNNLGGATGLLSPTLIEESEPPITGAGQEVVIALNVACDNVVDR